jgi:hypothetical protein
VKQAQWPVPGMFHNLIVFMIYRMGMWVFHSGHHVDFGQWLGQVDPRRFVHCAFVQGSHRAGPF